MTVAGTGDFSGDWIYPDIRDCVTIAENAINNVMPAKAGIQKTL